MPAIENIDTVVADMKAKFPSAELHLLTAMVVGEKHQIIVRSPSEPEYQEFRDYLSDDSKRTRAYAQLVRSCVVHPDLSTLNSLLAAKPGLTATFGTELTQIAGAVEDVESKKL